MESWLRLCRAKCFRASVGLSFFPAKGARKNDFVFS